eukprot:m.232681 g.232681  ORF g.232681 m.232681 type:complete len:346 (+) comp12393_c0_seq1:186-1223(+)
MLDHKYSHRILRERGRCGRGGSQADALEVDVAGLALLDGPAHTDERSLLVVVLHLKLFARGAGADLVHIGGKALDADANALEAFLLEQLLGQRLVLVVPHEPHQPRAVDHLGPLLAQSRRQIVVPHEAVIVAQAHDVALALAKLSGPGHGGQDALLDKLLELRACALVGELLQELPKILTLDRGVCERDHEESASLVELGNGDVGRAADLAALVEVEDCVEGSGGDIVGDNIVAIVVGARELGVERAPEHAAKHCVRVLLEERGLAHKAAPAHHERDLALGAWHGHMAADSLLARPLARRPGHWEAIVRVSSICLVCVLVRLLSLLVGTASELAQIRKGNLEQGL